MPRGASLSDSTASHRCCFSSLDKRFTRMFQIYVFITFSLIRLTENYRASYTAYWDSRFSLNYIHISEVDIQLLSIIWSFCIYVTSKQKIFAFEQQTDAWLKVAWSSFSARVNNMTNIIGRNVMVFISMGLKYLMSPWCDYEHTWFCCRNIYVW